MSDLSSFLTGLPAAQKAISALIAAGAIGAIFGVALVGFIPLPATVADNTAWRAEHTREFQNLVCLLTLPDGMSPEASIRECGL